MYVTKIKNNKPFNIAINTYNNVEEIAYYAMCSSYIPLICGKGLWTIYKKKINISICGFFIKNHKLILTHI